MNQTPPLPSSSPPPPSPSPSPSPLRDGATFEDELAAALTDRSLHLIVLPTEQCNFRCTYCYEDFAIGRMQPPTVQGIKLLLARRMGDLRNLNVSWFGGEPLLARTIVEDISSFIVDSMSAAPHLDYAGDVTTNGYHLDVSTAERWERLGIRSYQISLDGPEAVHDTTRRRANGGGSFQQIWSNLLALRRSSLPIRILLRIHLTPANVPSMREFLPELRDTFLEDDRFSVRLKPIEKLGGPNNDGIDVLDREARDRIHDDLSSLLRTGAPARAGGTRTEPCYASRPNSLVIRANGSIGKCTVALGDPSNTIGRIRPDGVLEIDGDQLSPWVRGWTGQDRAALTCPYAGLPRPPRELLHIGTRPPG
ncbi:radical SAM protein [Streptomyces sp. NPDC048349]|uniref:radical SAM protein n=1 Tax=Streptomyces sp. NPDC048349 TaxID=3155486 RepID=UPI003420CBA8